MNNMRIGITFKKYFKLILLLLVLRPTRSSSFVAGVSRPHPKGDRLDVEDRSEYVGEWGGDYYYVCISIFRAFHAMTESPSLVL